MNDLQLLPVGADLIYTVSFASEVPSTATVTGIVFTSDPALTLAGQTNDYPGSQASIRISGAAHGVDYALKAICTLDNSEDLIKVVPLRGFNG
jgi:hypothetical protein